MVTHREREHLALDPHRKKRRLDFRANGADLPGELPHCSRPAADSATVDHFDCLIEGRDIAVLACPHEGGGGSSRRRRSFLISSVKSKSGMLTIKTPRYVLGVSLSWRNQKAPYIE